jgi:hypothetical protein
LGENMTERNIMCPFYALPAAAVRRHDPDAIVIVGTSPSFLRFT